jgi:hypothetical protein
MIYDGKALRSLTTSSMDDLMDVPIRATSTVLPVGLRGVVQCVLRMRMLCSVRTGYDVPVRSSTKYARRVFGVNLFIFSGP